VSSTSRVAGRYALAEEQVELPDVSRRLVDRHVRPRAAEIDATGEFPDDVRQVLAEHDLIGIPFELRDGGLGTGALMLCVAIEEIAKACASSSLMLAGRTSDRSPSAWPARPSCAIAYCPGSRRL
jgi:alkylation response protein AidB-like acyl-CoA dehydrogenase